MGIRLEQPGAAKAAAAAGTVIGKGQRAEEDRARAEREQVRKQQIKAQEKARQAAMDFELQKMSMRSEQDFMQELRDRQYEFDRFNRAKEWDIEKMELTSRIDFEQEEKTRLQELNRIDGQILAVKKAEEDGQFTGREFEYESMLFNLEQQRFGIKNPSRPLDPQKRLFDQATRGQAIGGAGVVDGINGEGPLTDVSGYPLPKPTVSTLTAQHVHALETQQNKTFVVDKHTDELMQLPSVNADELLELPRYEKPEIVGTPTTRTPSKYPTTGRGFSTTGRFNF